jgi:hypothetical protein
MGLIVLEKMSYFCFIIFHMIAFCIKVEFNNYAMQNGWKRVSQIFGPAPRGALLDLWEGELFV